MIYFEAEIDFPSESNEMRIKIFNNAEKKRIIMNQ
jgi:hypothetical protein